MLYCTSLSYWGWKLIEVPLKYSIRILLWESAILVKGKSFVTSYTDFSLKQLMDASLKIFFCFLMENTFETKELKHFPLVALASSFNCFKKSIYKYIYNKGFSFQPALVPQQWTRPWKLGAFESSLISICLKITCMDFCSFT